MACRSMNPPHTGTFCATTSAGKANKFLEFSLFLMRTVCKSLPKYATLSRKKKEKVFALCNRDKAPYNNVVLECRPNPHVVCLKNQKNVRSKSPLACLGVNYRFFRFYLIDVTYLS
jgi:hypothetical protein